MRPRRAQSWRLGAVMCRSEQIGDTGGRGWGSNTSLGERASKEGAAHSVVSNSAEAKRDEVGKAASDFGGQK